MLRLIDILTYAVLIGCEFFAVCAMTRGGRPWPSRLLGFAVLVAANVAMESFWLLGGISDDAWLALQFMVCWLVLSGLTLWLSRDSIGRRIFLALCYGTYAIGYASCFDVIAYRFFTGDVVDYPPVWSVASGLAVVVVLTLVFVRWVLPRLPADGRDFRWRESCLVAGVMFAAMYASSVWPISVIAAPVRDCTPFVLVSVAAWIVFPMVCGRMRDRQRTVAVEHSLELMMAEMDVRRAAIDMARRLRHDQRHHRAQIAEYMLAGRYERVFDYLKELDEEALATPTDKLVWCENETVNAILSGAFRRAAKRGVRLEVTANVEKAVAIQDVDLVACVANLLENAIVACTGAEAEGGDGLRVCVSLRQREHGLGITVTNPVPAGFVLSEKGLPCAEPGVGLESVRRVVERHDGQWTYELDGDTLKCRIILMFSAGGES